MKIVVYPQHAGITGLSTNPYISDFVKAMADAGVLVANAPVRNPLIGMLPHCLEGDALVLHWLESVPDYKHGMVQTLCAVAMLAATRLTGHKVVWFLHNSQSHTSTHPVAKRLITRMLMRHSTLVVTHASQGIATLREQCPQRRKDAVWLHHPTKNRIDIARQCRQEAKGITHDLLIWGTISPYKGLDKWLEHMIAHNVTLRVHIVGRCADEALAAKITQLAAQAGSVDFENRSITFSELAAEVARSRFVLVPYAAKSVLSSGVLMDSLSVGAKVIGPDVGSFRDYAAEPLLSVYTFGSLDDVEGIVNGDDGILTDLESYSRFLDEHDWAHFARRFASLVEQA